MMCIVSVPVNNWFNVARIWSIFMIPESCFSNPMQIVCCDVNKMRVSWEQLNKVTKRNSHHGAGTCSIQVCHQKTTARASQVRIKCITRAW